MKAGIDARYLRAVAEVALDCFEHRGATTRIAGPRAMKMPLEVPLADEIDQRCLSETWPPGVHQRFDRSDRLDQLLRKNHVSQPQRRKHYFRERRRIEHASAVVERGERLDG